MFRLNYFRLATSKSFECRYLFYCKKLIDFASLVCKTIHRFLTIIKHEEFDKVIVTVHG